MYIEYRINHEFILKIHIHIRSRNTKFRLSCLFLHLKQIEVCIVFYTLRVFPTSHKPTLAAYDRCAL